MPIKLKSTKYLTNIVIPAKAGIQWLRTNVSNWVVTPVHVGHPSGQAELV